MARAARYLAEIEGLCRRFAKESKLGGFQEKSSMDREREIVAESKVNNRTAKGSVMFPSSINRMINMS